MPVARLTALCATVVLLGGCSWDGPGAAVRVVPPASTAPVVVASDDDGVIDLGRATEATTDPEVGAESDAADTAVRLGDDGVVVARGPEPGSVAVVGDSLTVSAEDEILEALANDGLDVLAIDGLTSRRMTHGGSSLPPGTAAIREIQQHATPDLWVIALGTNDVASGTSSDGFRIEMRELLELIPDDASVVWVDLWIRDRRPAISEANRVIREEIGVRQGDTAVVDWFSHGTDDGVVTGDGVHLTETGQRLFAASISASIEGLFAN